MTTADAGTTSSGDTLAKAKQMLVKNQATVVSTREVGDRLVRVTCSLREPDVSWVPGQALAVRVDPDGSSMKDRWRHYTGRSLDPAGRTMDLLVVRREIAEATPGQRWIGQLAPGSSFVFMGPGGKPTVGLAAKHSLFVGDSTSIASIASMVDALRTDDPLASAQVIVATASPQVADLTTLSDVATAWLPDARPIVDAIPDHLPAGTVAYATGEMQTVRSVRQSLLDRGLPRRSVKCQAHWAPARRGM